MEDVLIKVGDKYCFSKGRNHAELVEKKEDATEFNLMHDDGEIACAIESLSKIVPNMGYVKLINSGIKRKEQNTNFVLSNEKKYKSLEMFIVKKEYFDLDIKSKLELIKLMDEWLYFQKIKLNV